MSRSLMSRFIPFYEQVTDVKIRERLLHHGFLIRVMNG
jgi:hypothetical protein